MERAERGMMAWSLAGHDRGKLYVIAGVEEKYAWLCDGDIRPLEKPKKKNRKHIQIIKQLPKEITEVFTQENFRNEEIKRAIQLYQKSMEYQEETICQKQT